MSDVQVMLAAQAVAMRAMVNDLDAQAVDHMRTLAEELACSQPLYRAITGFATQFELNWRDGPALEREGRVLLEAVRDAAATHGAPVTDLPVRRDIDG